MSTPPFTFLSYAKQDTDRVHQVYKELKEASLQPWMDAPPEPYQLEGLTPGISWEDVLRKQLREARVVLAFMSKVSVVKEGYVQKDFRRAPSACAAKAPGTAALIPVLIDDCTPPEYRVDTVSLHDLQWYRLYEQGLDNLVLHLQAIISPTNPTNVANADYMDLIAKLNEARIDHDWQIKQLDKLRIEKDKLQAQHGQLQAEYEARERSPRDEDKCRERW